MHQLFPSEQSELTDDDIAAVYDWPAATAHQPWVRANFVQAVDGSIRGADGLSDGISGSADKRVFAILRATCDAVLVGAGTARAEDYGPITVRDDLAELRSRAGRTGRPRLFIVSRSGAINDKARDAAAEVLRIDGTPIELRSALASIRNSGVTRLLCEGGPHLFTSLVEADVIDDLCLTTSPSLLGNSTIPLITRQLPTQRRLRLASLLFDDSTLLANWALDPVGLSG